MIGHLHIILYVTGIINSISQQDDVTPHLQHNTATNTLLGGLIWTALTGTAGVIGYCLMDEDVGVFTGALCAVVTGVVCIDVMQWFSRRQ